MKRIKRPNPVFEIVFDGPGIVPEAIPVGSLTRVFSAIRRLVRGPQTSDADVDDEDEEYDEESNESDNQQTIRLLDVKRGSAVYQFVTDENVDAISQLRVVGQCLDEPEWVAEKEHILNPVEKLSAIAKRMNCKIVLRDASKGGGVLATIVPESYQTVSTKVFVSGDTSFVGKVERVGGATSLRCALRVSSRKRLLYCSVDSNETARELGKLLYRDAVVHGEARWIRGSWKVVRFKIKSVSLITKKPLKEVFERMRDAGGSDWDKVDDPQKLLDEARGK